MTLTALLFDNPITRLPSNLYNLFFSSDQSVQLPSKLPNDLIDTCKGVILDMDGVLRIKDQSIIGASDIIQKINQRGINGIIITNEDRYSNKKIRKDLKAMGIVIPNNWEIITSAFLSCIYLKQQISNQIQRINSKSKQYQKYPKYYKHHNHKTGKYKKRRRINNNIYQNNNHVHYVQMEGMPI